MKPKLAFASAKKTLNYTSHLIYQVWENSQLPWAPNDNVGDDIKTISASLRVHQTRDSKKTTSKYRIGNWKWHLQNTAILRSEPRTIEDDSLSLQTSWNEDYILLYCRVIIYVATWNVWFTLSVLLRRESNVHMCATTCSKYVTMYNARGWGWAPSTTTICVCNEYILPMTDDAEATVSAYFRSDLKLYQATNSWTKEDDNLLPLLKLHEWFQGQLRLAFKCIARLKRTWGSDSWTVTSLNYCYTSRTLRR